MILDTYFLLDLTRYKVVLKISALPIYGSVRLFSADAPLKTGSSRKFAHFLSHMIVCDDQMSWRNEYGAKIEKFEKGLCSLVFTLN